MWFIWLFFGEVRYFSCSLRCTIEKPRTIIPSGTFTVNFFGGFEHSYPPKGLYLSTWWRKPQLIIYRWIGFFETSRLSRDMKAFVLLDLQKIDSKTHFFFFFSVNLIPQRALSLHLVEKTSTYYIPLDRSFRGESIEHWYEGFRAPGTSENRFKDGFFLFFP